MMRLVFEFDHFQVVEKRAASGRSDSVYLTIAYASSEGFRVRHPPAGAPPWHIGAGVNGGMTLPLKTVIGPISILPETRITEAIAAVNLGDFDSASDEILAATKVGDAVSKIAFQAAGFMGFVPPLWMLGALTLLFGWLVGALSWLVSMPASWFNKPKCNGPVYLAASSTIGEQFFKAFPHGSVSLPLVTRPIQNGEDCGGGPDYRVVGTLRYELTPTPGDGPMLGRMDEHLDAFWVGLDGELMHTSWDGAVSSDWFPAFALAPKNSVQAGAVSSIARRPDHLDVFWIGRRGQLSHMWWNRASDAWSDVYELAGELFAAPGAVTTVARHPERIDVFWISPAGRVMSTNWDIRDATQFNFNDEHHQDWTDLDIQRRGTWAEPFEPDSRALAAPGAIRAVSRTLLSVDLFFIGPDGEVIWMLHQSENAKHKSPSHGSDPPIWWKPYVIAPARSAAPGALAAIARRDNHVDVFWIGPSGEVMHAARQHPGVGWSEVIKLAPIGSAQTGAITAVARHRDHIDVFWIGPSGEIRHMYWDGSQRSIGWSSVIELAPPRSAKRHSISAVARRPDHLDIFWVGLSGELTSMSWDAAFPQWYGPFAISDANTAQAGW